MCTTATQQIIYELHLAKSRKNCLRPLVETYNEGRPLGERLRSSHIKLAEFLLNLYFYRLKSAQGPGRRILIPGQPLPTLRTSNGALAKEMGVSSRTIINLRDRLAQAGIIADAVWHGTNSSYELFLNPMIMHLQTRQDYSNQNHRFFSTLLQTFRHIETGNLLLDTNKPVNKSGADFATGTENQSVAPTPAVENAPEPWKKAKKPVEKPATDAAQDTQKAAATNTPDTRKTGYKTAENPTNDASTADQTGNPGSAAPAASLPQSIEAATAHLSAANRNEVERIARSVWAYAHKELYSDKWLSNSVTYEAEVALAEYVAWWVKPAAYAKAKLILYRRIDMVRDWLDRDPARKEVQLGELEEQPASRWIPLPNRYFDMRNNNGFLRTQEWYNNKQRKTAAAKRKEALTKATNQYEKSLLPGAAYGPDQAYHKLTQALRKKYGQAIIREFQERIALLQPAQ